MCWARQSAASAMALPYAARPTISSRQGKTSIRPRGRRFGGDLTWTAIRVGANKNLIRLLGVCLDGSTTQCMMRSRVRARGDDTIPSAF